MRSRSALLVALLALAVGCPAAPAPAPTRVEPQAEPDPVAEAAPDEPDVATVADPDKRPPPNKRRKPGEAMGVTYDDELSGLDGREKSARVRIEKAKGAYLPYEQLAGVMMQRARTTGDFADYAKVEKVIEEAFTVRPPYGPVQTRAQFNFTLHRLDRIDDDLPRALAMARSKKPAARAALVVFMANVALQRGQYEEAEKHFAGAEALEQGSAKSALAVYWSKTGKVEEADAAFAELAGDYHGRIAEPAAWFDLMRAIIDLDHGRYDEALEHLDDGDADLAGYWLLDEHRAEITALKGDLAGAERMYRDIIERTNNPEFMDALAGVLEELGGHEEEAAQWVDKAAKRFEEQMAMFPEAAYGHALGHYLDFGPKEKALELAVKNHALRPNAEAKILLAQAQLQSEDKDGAKKTIEEALATPWVTADLYFTAHEVYTALGEAEKAAEQLAKAKAINPHVAD